MKNKLKISKKVKYSVIVNGNCAYSTTGACESAMCYKSPIPIKGNGLYVAKDNTKNI